MGAAPRLLGLARMRRLLCVSFPVLLGLLVGGSLTDREVDPPLPAVRTGGTRAARATARASEPVRAAPVQRGQVAAPVVQTSPAPPQVEAILERLDEEEGARLSPDEVRALERALDDPAADVALRAGALRALSGAQGRALLLALVELYPREDAAPLRPLLAASVSRGAGPDDRALLAGLVAAGEAARDPGGLVLALRGAVSAARRDPEDQPVRLDDALEERLVGSLAGLVQQAGTPLRVRREALEGLAELGGHAALRALETLEASAPDPEDRVEAATLRAR